MSQPLQPAKYYAKLICKYMKDLPDKYTDDPKEVQQAVGLSDAEFKLGLDLCVRRGIIKLEDSDTKANDSKPVTPINVFGASDNESANPYSMDEDGEEDLMEAVV